MSRLFSILFVFFSLVVAVREIPELNNLADDPSNDGEVFAWQRQTPVSTLHDVNKPRKEDPHQTQSPSLALKTSLAFWLFPQRWARA